MNRKIVKRFMAMVLTASMIIPSVPVNAEAAGESSQDAAAEEVFLPEAAYYWDFEDGTTLANKGTAEGTAALKGTAEITNLEISIDTNKYSDSDNSVLSLKGGSKGSSYVELPSNLYEGVSAETGLTWSFWMKEASDISNYSRVFSSSKNNSNEVAYAPCTQDTGWNLFLEGAYHHSYAKTENQPSKDVWNYITITISGDNKITFYTNGVEVPSGKGNSGDVKNVAGRLNDLAGYNSHALGMTTKYNDADCKVQLDDVAIYKSVLTAEQVKAAYESYLNHDEIKTLRAAVPAKLAAAKEAIEGKSISFYTRESYTTLQNAINAIDTGKIAVVTPATKEQLTKLSGDLDTKLVYYDGITAETTFSNAQLAAENTAAKKIISDGGLTKDARDKIQTAVTAADAALSLTDETAENQATVDAALIGLREAVDGLNADALAVPTISKQPMKEVYNTGETASPLTVEATLGIAGDDDKSLKYQWYQNTVKKTEGGTKINGATDKSYTPSIAEKGKTYYYCEVTNTNPAIPEKSKAINSNVVQVRVNGTEEVIVPQPYYEFTFDATGDNGTEVTNQGSKTGVTAKIEGEKSGLGIIEDEGRASKVLNLPGGDEKGKKEGRLSLPENMFADVTNDGFAFSFWINIDEKTEQYSRIFSGTVNGQNSDVGNNAWNAPEFSFVAGKEGAGDLGENGGGYHTAILVPDGADDNSDGKADHSTTQLKLVWEEQFAKGKWQHVTISVSPTSYDVYLDGEKIGIKYDRNNNTSTVLSSLFANDAVILKQYADCSIGASVYQTDKDLKAKVDEFRFYNTALTMEQAEAAYDSYAVDKSLVAGLQAKVDEAKNKNKGISFHTRASYETLISAIAAGEEGIENPVTKEYVEGLISRLDEAIQGLTYYNGVTETTTFSKAQLQDETDAANDMINEGGLTSASETAILAVIDTAKEALALTGTEANAQATVDAALKTLRTAVDAAVYEEAAATPQISDDGQPKNASYTKDDTIAPVAPLTVTATASDKGTLSYQWYQNTTNSTTDGTIIEGADKASYTPVITEAGTIYYYCEVKNTQNKATTTKTATIKSNTASVTVKEVAEPTITMQGENALYEVGETASALTVTATVNDEGTLSYQWYKKASESAAGEAISGATSASYTPAVTAIGETYYYCAVTNTIGTATKTVNSSSVLINVVEDKSAVAARPTITKEPEDAEYKTGDTAQPLAVEATKSDEGTLSYQWYKKASENAAGEAISGATGASYTPVITDEGTTYYYCIVTNTKGDATETATSRVAKITVTKGGKPPVTETEASEPTITKEPKDAEYKTGDTVQPLIVEATVSDGGTLSYQWYRNTADNTEDGTAVENAASASYTPVIAEEGITYYYCIVTNTKGGKKATKASRVAKITVTKGNNENGGKPPVTDTEKPPVTVNKGTNSITGVSDAMTVIYGKSITLAAKGQGAITYASSNPKVLTVGTTDGKIKTTGYGKATITITAAGDNNYNSVAKTITVTVKPKKMTVSSVKSAKKKTLTVKWKKDAKADGYKIQYSMDKKFKKGVKTTTVKKSKTVKTTLKKLKAGKKYYVRICAYKGSGKNQVSGDWSKAKKVTVKKK